MKVTPDDYGRRCQFDHFCKLVLYHEAVDYFRERKRQRGWETSFETLPLSELDTLCTIDQYPSDSFIFPAYGCELQISDGLVAAAFASLPQPGQSILILHCVHSFPGFTRKMPSTFCLIMPYSYIRFFASPYCSYSRSFSSASRLYSAFRAYRSGSFFTPCSFRAFAAAS